jgi:hypothetical protein
MTTREEYFGDDEIRFEYSTERTCPLSDSGFHCSCYDDGTPCHICEGVPPWADAS